jgi:hypothetical protein
LTGRIERQKGDAEKLVRMIARNRGWLAAIYLRSPGGSIYEGRRLGQLVRMFWLKTYALEGKTFTYRPDFALAPLGRPGENPPAASASAESPSPAGWQAYFKTVAALPPIAWVKGAGIRCASSCSMIHMSGIDRHGVVYVHRPRYGGQKGSASHSTRSMSEKLEGLQRALARQIAFYQQMDAGEEFIRLYQSTPTQRLTPATGARNPRIIADLLLEKCGTDPAPLQDLDTQLRVLVSAVNAKGEGYVDISRLRKSLEVTYERRKAVEKCVAGAHENERLTNFAELCPDGCDQSRLLAAADARLRKLDGQSGTPRQGKTSRVKR